ncbi:ARM repeat-containing protein [Epithele typhae]|uniref:ARM repeat-containing protein n=1 Tax=Epithele typhae TaxID=378194 RepID=UPI0020079CDA|nr:ARM repeat-containing protein [Epithele typhae]KAH9943000.1 ARM repeat-containing protein [Epithele typhae]
MPRENRKRGKKHKKKADEEQDSHGAPEPRYEEASEVVEDAGPSWIKPAREDTVDMNAPFGYVDSEVKAYFRTVDVQIREWQNAAPEPDGDEEVDPNEDRRLFFMAALSEISEKEKQLATDPDCSTILERMVHSMDDFARRVFTDRLSGSLEQLSKHRFASHVCQTLLSTGSETVSRETRGIFPPIPESEEDAGELRTFAQLVLDACEELLPSMPSLVMDQFASHVLRTLLQVLAPDVLSTADDLGDAGGKVRSKKSAAYKARQGPMKSVFTDNQRSLQYSAKHTPKEFRKAAKNITSTLRESLGENEVRAMAANPVASPVLQASDYPCEYEGMLLELEAAYGMADSPGSLMDHALVGLITSLHNDPEADAPESDYLTTLLRDPTASHLLEALVQRSPQRVFDVLWKTYFMGKLHKLGVHPVANFVVAKAFERLTAEQLVSAVDEIRNVATKVVKNARIGVLRALVDRACIVQGGAEEVVLLISSAFELDGAEDKSTHVQCILRLLSPEVSSMFREPVAAATEGNRDGEPRHKKRKTEDPLEPKTQGAVLLQSILRLPSPHNDIVLDSICTSSPETLIEMSHHPTSSRILDALLTSTTVPPKARRTLTLTLLPYLPALVDDRIGSRVGERLFAAADPYLREKIARAAAPHHAALAGSYFGKFFVRGLALHVLQRDPERWKAMQAEEKERQRAQIDATGTVPAQSTDMRRGAEEKRSQEGEGEEDGRRPDEIDEVFGALGGKVKKAELAARDAQARPSEDGESGEKGEKKSKKKRRRDEDGEERGGAAGLEDVLGAIRSAPKEEKKRRHKH